MKRFLNLLQPHLVKPIVYSAVLKLALGICGVLLWHRFSNSDAVIPVPVSHGFFFAWIYLLLWAWFQYLAFDGFHPLGKLLRERDADAPSPGGLPRLKDLINQRIETFSELEEEEQTVAKLCADLIAAGIFLILSLL